MLFVTGEILLENIICLEYPDNIRQSKNHKESGDTLDGLLEFTKIDKMKMSGYYHQV